LAIDYSRRQQIHKGVTQGQFEAVTEAMKLIIQEDRERGLDATMKFICPACGDLRTRMGSVEYEGLRICNDCATGYEVARISHSAGTCAEYVAKQAARRN
jgi:hypothetical protein